jgi:hypothetical protein
MVDEGADSASVGLVTSLVAKARPAGDELGQAHEDALCLVFIESQVDETAERLGASATATVLAKTLAKMSPRARALAREVRPTPPR